MRRSWPDSLITLFIIALYNGRREKKTREKAKNKAKKGISKETTTTTLSH